MKKEAWRESLQELLLNVAGNGFFHLSDIEGDLLQINLLLMEAINKLGDNVVAIGQVVERQQVMIRQLVAAGNCSPFVAEKLDDLGGVLDGNISEVVTAMQFQDMTAQLLDKVLSRVDGLQSMLGVIEKLASDISTANGDGDAQAMIKVSVDEMAARRQELEGLHAERVSQHHMGAGTVELF